MRYGNVSLFLSHRGVATRVAPRGLGVPHEHGQNLCHRVPSVAGSSFLTGADMKGNVGPSRESEEEIPSHLGKSRQ